MRKDRVNASEMDKEKGEKTFPIVFEFLDHIKRSIDKFTPRQRRLAQYILHTPESLAFLPITDLARDAGVSQATVVRFCNTLGYDGYSQLAREVQQGVQAELGTKGRFQLARHMHRDIAGDEPADTFERILSQEIKNLMEIAKNVKRADFEHCVDMMADADRLCVIGSMSSGSLATFMGDMLSKISPQVDVITNHGVMTSAIIQRLTRQSLVFLVSFPRYPKTTLELGKLVKSRKARIVAITNSHISPIVPLANLSFFLPIGIPSFVDAYAAPMVFINALAAELSERNPEMAQEALAEFDEYVSKIDLFITSEKRRKSAGS
jgi:DNA-binding MurR/RpiR family transcriptional regulator